MVNPKTPDKELATRAFEIADDCMLALFCCATQRIDEYGIVRAITDSDGNDVHDIAEADDSIRDALDWLVKRGRAEVVVSPAGLVAVLTKDVPHA